MCGGAEGVVVQPFQDGVAPNENIRIREREAAELEWTTLTSQYVNPQTDA
jgi:hypothetical protein